MTAEAQIPTAPALPPVASVVGAVSSAGAELREVFSRTLARSKGSAQLVVAKGGETLIDVAGNGMTEETPLQVFSVSKFMVAVAAAHAHEAGLIDLDAPVSSYWATFDREATRAITARHILEHSSGINGVDRPLLRDELIAGGLEDEVARQNPRWVPGTEHGYHAFTFGALMAGVFLNGTGTTVQDYVEQHVVAPAGGGFWYGAPDDVLPRLARLTFDPVVLTEGQAADIVSGRAFPDGSMVEILTNPEGFFTDPRVQQARWPAMSGVTTARALARIGNALLGHGVDAPLISRGSLEAMIAVRSEGMDRTLGHVSRFGSGVELPHGYFPYLGGRSFGHQGAGGQVIAVDPDSELVVAYTCTNTQATVGGSDAALILLQAARFLAAES